MKTNAEWNVHKKGKKGRIRESDELAQAFYIAVRKSLAQDEEMIVDVIHPDGEKTRFSVMATAATASERGPLGQFMGSEWYSVTRFGDETVLGEYDDPYDAAYWACKFALECMGVLVEGENGTIIVSAEKIERRRR